MKKIVMIFLTSILIASCSDGINEKVVCEESEKQMMKLLKAPSTAVFHECDESRMERSEMGDGYIVEYEFYVDSQNGFGAMLRSDYYCNVFVDNKIGPLGADCYLDE